MTVINYREYFSYKWRQLSIKENNLVTNTKLQLSIDKLKNRKILKLFLKLTLLNSCISMMVLLVLRILFEYCIFHTSLYKLMNEYQLALEMFIYMIYVYISLSKKKSHANEYFWHTSDFQLVCCCIYLKCSICWILNESVHQWIVIEIHAF